MSKKRLIAVGVGEHGLNWCRVIQRHPQWELAGVVDPAPGALASAQAALQLQRDQLFATLQDAVRATKVDTALLIVPPRVHLPLVKEAFAAGLHVMLEKPLVADMTEVQAIQDAVQQARPLQFMVTQQYRYRPGIVALTRALREGAIGRLGYVVMEFHRFQEMVGWRKEMRDELLEDMAIHHLDLLRAVTGLACETVYAESFTPPWAGGHGVTTAVTMRMEGGVRAQYVGSFAATGAFTDWNGRIRLVGSDGTLTYEEGAVTLHRPDGSTETVAQPAAWEGDQAHLLTEMAAAIDQGREPATGISDNLWTFALSHAAIESAHTGQPVSLRDFVARFVS